MNKKAFIAALRDRLTGLDKKNLETALDFYSEMIDDLVESGLTEEEAVSRIGAPEDIARQIIDEIVEDARQKGAAAYARAKSQSEKSGFLSRFKTGQYTRKEGSGETAETTYLITEPFRHIRISGSLCDVTLLPAQDGQCKLVHRDYSGATLGLEVQEDTLCIERQGPSGRSSSIHFQVNINIFDRNSSHFLKLYLPQSQYEALRISTTSGDIKLPEGFVFGSMEVSASSGDVEMYALSEGDVRLQTTSGDITMKKTRVQGNLAVKCSSGDMELVGVYVVGEGGIECTAASGEIALREIRTRQLTATAASGDMELESLSVEGGMNLNTASGDIALESCQAGSMRINTASGDVKLEDSDAGTLYISTTSGDISGRLRTGKTFTAKSLSGDIRLPQSVDGGKCMLHTVSGDIDIKVKSEK